MQRLIDCCITDFESAKEITNEWIESVIDNNFTDFEHVSVALKPTFFENDEIAQRDAFKKLRERLIQFEQAHDSNEIWNELSSNDRPAKKLVVLMWYAVELALPKNSSQIAVQTGTAAATSYIILCSIKGSSAYNIFNQFFYERCFELFRQVQRSYTFGTRENVQLKAKPKQKGKKKVQEAIDETEVGEEHLDREIVSDLLDEILRSFFILFPKIALGSYQQPAILTTSLLRDICNIDKDNKNIKVSIVSHLKDFDSLRSKNEKAFALFHQLADDKHSTGGELIHSRIVFPRLSFWGMDNGSAANSIPASFIQWRDLILRFLQERIHLKVASELRIILRVLQNLCCRCIDKSDYRLKVTGSVVEVVNLLPRQYKFEFAQDLITFSQNAKTSIRNFAVECIPALLRNIDFSGEDPGPLEKENVVATTNKTLIDKTIKEEIEDEPMEEAESDAEEKKKKKSQKKKNPMPEKEKSRVDTLIALNQCLIRLSLDKTSNIRGRAVVHISQLLQDDSHKKSIQKVANEMIESDKWLYVHRKQNRRGEAENDDDNNEEEDEDNENHLDDSMIVPVENLILYIIKKAAEDKAASVRKSGVLALGSYLPEITESAEFDGLLRVIIDRCVDCSVIVRKQAAECLSDLLKEKTLKNELIEAAWLEYVLPMMNDREQSVQQAASKLIYENLVNPLVGKTTDLTWILLNCIEQQDNHRRLLVRTLFYLSQEGVITENIVKCIYNKLKAFPEKDNVLWMILGELAIVFKVSPELALYNWYKFTEDERNNKVRYVAKVLTASTSQMNSMETKDLVDDIKSKLKNHSVAPPHISSVYLLLAKLLDAIGESAPGKRDLEAFAITILKHCQKQVKKHIDEFGDELLLENDESYLKMETRLISVITTIGEVIQFSPTLMDKCEGIVDALKIIMASEQIQEDKVLKLKVQNSHLPSLNTSYFASRPPTGMQSERNGPSRGPTQPTVPSQFNSQQTENQGASQQLQHKIIPNSHHVGNLFTPVVRAYCVLALGKFCLMDYKRAKECVPVFVNQLRVNSDFIVRNNIILVICDLCIRNTQLVDRYSPIIASCLKDQSTLVRHQTLESLTNLIKEQYIRWEGQIMYRFVSTILDEDTNIRKYAEFCLENVLLKQFPDMFYRHFIECLLYFNDISKNHLTGESEDVEIDAKFKFTLSGEKKRADRMKLYKFMIKTFDDKDKFTIMAHICEKALMPAVLGEIEFNDKKVQSLLRDSFEIMSSKEIKLSMDVGKGNEEDEEEPPAAVLAEAKKMISAAYRKGIIQTIMPHLLDVRAFLIEKRSPLLKNCLIVLRNICIEHKEQIEEVLSGDKQLQVEIEYDIKKFEEQIAHEQRLAKAAEEQRRRSVKSLAAAEIIMSAVKDTAKRQARINKDILIEPIPMEIEEEIEQNTTITGRKKKSMGQRALGAQTEPSISNHEKTPVEDTLKTIGNENISPVEGGKKDITYVKAKTPSPIKQNNEENIGDNDFIMPAIRKRTRGSSIQIDESAMVAPRACSTPNKPMTNLTFTNLELSAIQSEKTQNRRASRKLSSRQKTMDPIEEDQSAID